MARNINNKIERLKDLAINRCRERIERVKCKAKELLNGKRPKGQNEGKNDYTQPYGVTSVLKKRHEL
jgi:hypothetical protein